MAIEKEFCLRSLAEAIILQAAEDLWDEDYRKQSTAFFSDEGFSCWAMIAGMTLDEQVRFLWMLKEVLMETLPCNWALSDMVH